MTDIIDYYYAPASGYAYLGEKRLVEIAKNHGVEIRFKPVDIMRVFSESGTVPPPKQSSARFIYRLLDLQRTADYLGLPINPKPKYWPVPVELAARSIYAVISMGIDPHNLSFAILSAVYAQEKDITDEQVIDDIFTGLELDSDEIWKLVRSESTAKAFENATREAIEIGIFGSPAYVLNGEHMYFGQDRLRLLEYKLSS